MESITTSTTIKKPWGGQLAASQEIAIPEDRDLVGSLGLLLRKFAELSALSTLVAVPLMYHFGLRPNAFQFIGELCAALQSRLKLLGVDFFENQLSPYLIGQMPVLESKFSAWFVMGTAMFAGYAALRVLEALTRRPILSTVAAVPESSRSRRHRLVPLICITGFILYSLLSFLLWAPDPPPEAQLLAGRLAASQDSLTVTGKLAANLGGAAFFHSMVAWLQVTFALFYFLVLEDLIRTRHFVNRILGLLLIVGVLNAIVVLLQKIEFGPLMQVWILWAADESRNNLGAFIGHNTGVSSFLITPLLVSLMWMFLVHPGKRQVFRVLMLCCFLVMALAVILAQSRAVIPILSLCGVLMATLMARWSCILSKSRLYVWLPVALVFLVLTQLIPSSMNPLYRRDVTLVKRLEEFRVSRLLTETRLRMMVVSMSELVPNSPIIGYGFGSFQYVFPKAQGEFYEHNDRSLIAPTPKRSFHAHNEYLQTLVETGVIGLAIALLGVAMIMHGGWTVLRRTLMPHHCGVQIAVLASIVALLMHCFVDFPLRVPPLALTLVALLAIWSAGDRLWIFPVKTPREESEESEKESTPTPERPVLSRRLDFTLTTAGITLALLLLGGAALANVALMNRFLSAAVFINRGSLSLESYQSNPRLNSELDRGWNDAHAARRILWISGPANRLNGQAQYFRAFEAYGRADQLARQNNLPLAAKTRAYAEILARNGISDLNMALSEERYHTIYRIRSALNKMIADNSPEPQRRDFEARATEDLYRAVNMNPGDPNSIQTLIEVLERDPSLNHSEVVRYLGTLHHFHRDYFQANIYGRVADALSLDENQDALVKMRSIVDAVKNEPDYVMTYAITLLRNGHTDHARQIAQAMMESIPNPSQEVTRREFAQMLQLGIAITLHDDEEAQRIAAAASGFKSVPPALVKSYQLYVKPGDRTAEENRKRLRAELEDLGREDPINYQIAGVTAYSTFHDWNETILWLEKRRDAPAPAPPMDLQGQVILAKAYFNAARWDDLQRALEEITCDGRTPYSRRLCFAITRFMRDKLEQSGAKTPQDEAKP